MLKLHGHRGQVRGLAFSPDSRRLASIAGSAMDISLWDLPGGRETRTSDAPLEVQAVAFTPDGEFLVFASGRYLCRWDLQANAIQEKWLRGANHCHCLAVSPDGSLLAAACFSRYDAGDCFRVDLFHKDSLPKKTWLVGDYGTPYSLAFSPDGRFLATGGWGERVRLFSLAEKQRASSWKCAGRIHALAFTPDGSLVAVAAGDALTLYDTASRKPCGELTGHGGTVRALGMSPDGTLLSAGDDGTARLWDLRAGRQRAAFDWQVGPLGAAAFSPDGMLAAAGGADGLVVWDVE
jgi:WD40 repeat protein